MHRGAGASVPPPCREETLSHSVQRSLHMSLQLKGHPGRILSVASAMFAVLCAFGSVVTAQDQPLPKVELFAGYSFWLPGANINGQLPGSTLPLTSRLESNPRGMGASATYDFNRWFGLTLDGSIDLNSGESTLARRIDDAAFANISFGPKLTYRTKHFAPFVEVLVGDHRLSSD